MLIGKIHFNTMQSYIIDDTNGGQTHECLKGGVVG